jgi:hypothetical protein
LKVLLASTAGPSAATTEYWQEQDGKLLVHGLQQPGGEVVRYEPPYVAYRYCMDVGDEWSTTTTRTEGVGSRPTSVVYRFTVLAAEPVQTASGAYPAFKILRQDNDTGDGSTEELTIWFSPYTGMVKRQVMGFTLDLKGSNLR